jgi:hypothetical protein
VGIRCADHATPSTRKRLALTSPISGGRSVGIVRLRTKATEFSLVLDIHASNGIRTHDPSVWVGEGSSCPRPGGHQIIRLQRNPRIWNTTCSSQWNRTVRHCTPSDLWFFLFFFFYFFFLFGLWDYRHCGHSWPIVPASGDNEDDCGEHDGM